jgi:hypothetical protein
MFLHSTNRQVLVVETHCFSRKVGKYFHTSLLFRQASCCWWPWVCNIYYRVMLGQNTFIWFEAASPRAAQAIDMFFLSTRLDSTQFQLATCYVVTTVHFGMKLYNDQRNAQGFNFIYIFTSALHVSDFLLAHFQRQVYTFGSGSSLLGMVSAPMLPYWKYSY